MQFFKKFLSVMTEQDRKRFWIYLIVLFIGSVSSVLGIGAVVPFMMLLLDPQKLSHIPLISSLSFEYAVLVAAMALIGAFWLKNIISLLLLSYQSKFLGSVVRSVQSRLFHGYMSMDYEYHLNRSTPDLIRNLTTECIQFSSSIVQPLGTMLTAFFSILFVVIFLLFMSPIFTLVIASSLILVVTIFIRALRAKARHYGLLRSQSNGKMNKAIFEGLQGIKESKLYHKEDMFEKFFNRHAYDFRQATIFSQIFAQAPRFLIEASALTVVMLAISAYVFLGVSGSVLMLLLSVFGVAAAQLLPNVNQMTQAMAQIRYYYRALETIADDLQRFKDVPTQRVKAEQVTPIAFEHNIKLDNIHYAYQDGTQALKGVSLTIEKNQKTAFVGRSGAGKSTLVDLIMGLYRPQMGDIIVDGKPLTTDQEIASFQKLFGYIPQQIILYDASIKENIAFGTPVDQIDEKLVWDCLAMAQMDTFVQEMPNQLESFVGESGIRLSGGQRQRIGIARALYHKPQILVMDEATSALDNHTEKQITNILATLNDLTIITIAHRLTTIQDYDKIVLMDSGGVQATGPYKDLDAQSEYFAKLTQT